jgi:ATP-dependent RNA helicase RhlB
MYLPADDEKLPLLLGLLSRSEGARTMVFVNTKAFVERVARALERAGYRVGVLSGDVPQKKRESLLKKFQAGQLEILVATDVAARGLHIDGVSHVYNYDLPFDAEDYVHRIGRTARLGAEGDAISFACERYAQSLPDIEAYIEQKIPVEPITADLLVSLPRKPREGVEAMADDGESVSAIFREAREARAAEEQRRGGGRSGGGGRGSSHGGRSAGGEGRRERTPRPPRAIEAAVQAPKPAAPVAAAPVAAAPVAANAVAAADGERAPRKRRRRRGGKRIEGAEAAAIPQQAKGPSEVVATRVAPRPAAARSGTDKAGASGEPSLLSRIGRGLKSLVTRAPRSQH